MALDRRTCEIGHPDGVAAGIGSRTRRSWRLAAHGVQLQALLHRQGPGKEVEQIDAAVGRRSAPTRLQMELFDLLGDLYGLLLIAGKLQGNVLQIDIVGVELHLCPGLLQGPGLRRLWWGLRTVVRPLRSQCGCSRNKTQKQGRNRALERPATHGIVPCAKNIPLTATDRRHHYKARLTPEYYAGSRKKQPAG